ncbi:NAD(P)H-dependent oxidoreductase [Shewanella surugensis]|uniref:NAD(P)H-dependent oxidoreductase n=1 Tax=Shewanella surugensis TaxID=212020 RepID=A0ABT0LBY9_9GAMM|nr:NAD(P)H-dependent oxidoreductase [Shewanella surugensis]MCL1125206.1 NAD(P)H-dependent oxidoreductase [Shewanella surugensis]
MQLTFRDACRGEAQLITEFIKNAQPVGAIETTGAFFIVTEQNIKDWCITIVEDKGKIIGFMGLERVEQVEAAAGLFALDKSYRDGDLGIQLIKDIKGKLREYGVRHITFQSAPDTLELFKNIGAEVIGEIDSAYMLGGKALLLRLNLVKALPQHSVEQTLDKLFCCEENIVRTKPKVLFLYGSLREGSYSRMLADEAARIMETFGAETKVFHPHDIPIVNTGLTQSKDESALPKSVIELRDAVSWSDAMVWISPEIHGGISATFKNMIDWLPLNTDAKRSSQGKIVALMQISGGSQSFNAVNQMRVLGRWMRCYTIPNQSSLPTAYNQFHKDGTLVDSFYRDRVIDVLEELFRFTLLLRGNIHYLVQRWSEESQIDSDEPRPLITFQSAVKSLTS